MVLSAADILADGKLHDCIRAQSRALLGIHEQNSRLASVFATQQRWLMAHAGLALYFSGDRSSENPGLLISRFLDTIGEHAVASRNTADAFLKEMIHYKFVRYVPDLTAKRMRPMEPTEMTLAMLDGWLRIHLATLDALDSGNRQQTYSATPGMLAVVQPKIAFGLLSSNAVREPEQTFSLFTWLNNGGAVMDWLIAGIAETDPDAERVATGVVSVSEMADWLRLSRTHLARKLRDAESLGSIGWEGRRGHSVMWVSRGFRQEYARAQAVKLAIIDAAYTAVTTASAPALPA